MRIGITRRKTPEERELEKKLAEFTALQAELTQNERSLINMQAELHAFEKECVKIVGTRYAQLDQIETQIAQYWTYLNPKKLEAHRQAVLARARTQVSRETTRQRVSNQECSIHLKPSESLNKLYRDIAKRIHPDLATDRAERLRRQHLMAEVNQAYEDGNEEQLQAILSNWEGSPESIQGEGVAAELIRLIRKIAQVQERLTAVGEQLEALKQSALYQLRRKVLTGQQQGRDLLAEMAWHLDEQISTSEQRLRALKAQVFD
ncbi:MAG: hypothetical protein NVS2B14_05180 [Chamaesiphon sp.]